MFESTIPNTNPKKNTEVLAMLYLKNQDLSGKTPVQIHELYWKAYYEIESDYIIKNRQGFFVNQNHKVGL